MVLVAGPCSVGMLACTWRSEAAIARERATSQALLLLMREAGPGARLAAADAAAASTAEAGKD